ncbi:MAG: protealysin inhibitor emfourin [Thermodesulfobacteriota bacterium]
MRISFERSGGFAGIIMKTAVDEKDLAPGEAQKLRQLVEEADFFNSPGKITSRSPQPDRFQYELRLEEKGRQHAVTVSEEVMPAKLKPLVQWLMGKARQTSKDKESR